MKYLLIFILIIIPGCSWKIHCLRQWEPEHIKAVYDFDTCWVEKDTIANGLREIRCK